MAARKKRLVIAISGATGVQYAVRILQLARSDANIETHLIISPAGVLNLKHELDVGRTYVQSLADHVYSYKDVGATLASGGFATDAMVVVPCSMRTLAAVAHGLSDNLITRAADVTLKERRRLVLMVRETPFNLAHLRNMTAVTEMGGIIFPPLPAFYMRPNNIDELIEHTVHRVFELLDMANSSDSWQGLD